MTSERFLRSVEYRHVKIFMLSDANDDAGLYEFSVLYQLGKNSSAVEVMFFRLNDACDFINDALDNETHFYVNGNLIAKSADKS